MHFLCTFSSCEYLNIDSLSEYSLLNASPNLLHFKDGFVRKIPLKLGVRNISLELERDFVRMGVAVSVFLNDAYLNIYDS